MKELGNIILFKYPNARMPHDIIVEDDGQGGGTISRWRLATPKPTPEELQAVAASPEFAEWKVNGGKPNRHAVKTSAAKVVQDLDAYLALSNPNPTQTAQAVRLMAQSLKVVYARLAEID